MAKPEPGIYLTGALCGLCAYKKKGSDIIILRAKGGASKERIKRDPAFASTRRINAELGGCSGASRWPRRTFQPLQPISDYNMAALLMPLQKPDTESPRGCATCASSCSPACSKQ